MQQLLDDEIDTDEYFRDKDSIPLVEDVAEEEIVRELTFDSKFDRDANFKEMAEDFTATDEWE